METIVYFKSKKGQEKRNIRVSPVMNCLLKILLVSIFLPTGLFGQNHLWRQTINYAPFNPTITGPDTTCSGFSGYTYSTEAGMSNYTWMISSGGNIISGGTTNTIIVTWNSSGAQTVSVTYNSIPDPAVMNVTVLQSLTVGISISASANPVCAGTPVTFTATPSNGGSSPDYDWKVNGITVCTSTPTYTYIPSDLDQVSCQLTSSITCAIGNPAISNVINMSVDPNLPVSVSISASANPVCQGVQVTFTATPINGGTTPVFQWKVNGVNQGSNSTQFTYTLATGDVVTCQLTSNAQCVSGNPATSNPVTMTVSPGQPVSVTIAASSNPSCLGNQVTFTATPVNGGSSPVYEWKVDGVVSGTNSPVFSYNPANGDIVTCMLTSNASCATGNPASTAITMSVNPNMPVNVSITASSNPSCLGSSVTFTATVLNGGSTPVYQWMINGMPVGTNSSTMTYVPGNGDNITCIVISSLECTTGNPATSNAISMSVVTVLPVGISISPSSNPVCIGNTVTLTATPYNGGATPVYQWKVNGINAGTNSTSFTYTPSDGDIVICVLNSSATCATGNPAISNPITMTVSPNQPVSVTITVSSNPVCQGIPVFFTATPTNGGTSPVYQWKVNGFNAGTNSTTFSYSPINNDTVRCYLTSSIPCTTGNPATSNGIVMIVNQGQTLPVSVTITASVNPSCQGQTVTYTATPVNGGTSPVYQWMVNGINVGTNSPTYSYSPTNGDFVKCQLTSSYFCATGNPATSNQITMTVNPNLTVSVSIAASANPSCQGSSVTFTATNFNGGTTPTYQWKVNGLNVGTNSTTYTYTPVNVDIITCRLTSSIQCTVTNPVTSNAITMIVYPVLPVSVSISASTNPACTGSSVTFTATPVNAGTAPIYHWSLNGTNVGSNSTILMFIPLNGDVVSCQLISNALCVSGPRTVQSNVINMVVANNLPASVSIAASSNPFCQGTPVTFTATPTNGGTGPSYQWKVNCINAGTNNATFTYTPQQNDFVYCQMTSNLGCVTQSPAKSNGINMTLNSGTPAGITISASANPVCTGSSVTFTATTVNGGTTPDYQWKVNGSNVGTNNPTYTCTPTNGNIVTCQLTSNAACVSGNPALSNAMNMVVSSSLPAAVSIIASSNPTCPGSMVTFTAAPVNGGSTPVFQWKVNGINVGSFNPFSYYPVNNDTVYCMLTSSLSCASGNPAISNKIVMAITSPLPVSVSISANSNPVCAGTSVTFTAMPTNSGNTPVYQWQVNGVNAGINNPVFTYVPVNADMVTCQLTSGLSCATGNPAISNAITMTVNPILPVSVSIAASANPCCAGTAVTFTATAVNPGSSPVYQWKVNCVNVGTNSPTYTFTPVHGDVVICQLTSNALCTSGNPALSDNINMIVFPVLPVSIAITPSVNPFCLGSPVTFTSLPMNGGTSPGYQWKVNGSNINGANNSTLVYTPANSDTITCLLTSSSTCVSGNPALSNPVVMIGEQALPVSISITANNPVCEGTLVPFIATPLNGGASPNYQWKVNGSPAGSNNHIFQYYPANNDVVVCQLTSSLNCASGNPAMSNAITMTVYPIEQVAISIVASINPSCVGQTVTFTATPTYPGNAPTYQWKVNGINVGTNSTTYSYIPSNGDVVTCRLKSSDICVTNNPTTSAPITMIVSPSSPASITIAASANPSCQGSPVTFTASPFNGGTSPIYQWKVNGINAGTNSPTFTYQPVNGDIVTCFLTSNSICITITTATSNAITMIVSPIQPVTISIAASSNPSCLGSQVTFIATVTNPGTSPVYLWKVNGNIVGSNTSFYTYIPSNGDVVNCKLTSNATCSSGNPATSNSITMTVSTSLPVSVSIGASTNPSCQGTPVTFTANGINGGSGPTYQWMVNGIYVGTNSPVYINTPTNGDIVICRLTSSHTCATGNPAFSNQVNMTVNQNLPVSVSITSNANPSCQGTPVNFTATPVNGGSSPSYQWKVSGANVGGNLPTYCYIPLNGDSVCCVLTSNAQCPITNPVSSNKISMNVLQSQPVGINISASNNPTCPSSLVTFTAITNNGGFTPTFQWKINGINVGTNLPTYTYSPTNGDVVTCQLTSSATCITNNPAVSNPVTMTVSTDLPVSVTITPSANPACQGQMTTFTAIPVNGGTNPTYQWLVNGINVGTNSPVYSFSPSTGDSIICQLTSDFTCASGNPATSNKVVMTVNQNIPASISITCSSNPACLASPVTFTASPVNGGSSPVFQWQVNGVNAGTNLSSFTYIPVNGDIVTCSLTSSLTCVSNNPVISNPVNMLVSSALPVNVTIGVSANPVCLNIPVTFTATQTNGGSTPAYQWMINGVDTGSNSPVFTYTPANGDVVTCTVTSNLTCATGSPATSNAVTMSVLQVMPVGVTIGVNPSGPVCAGTPVTFTATPVNGGIPTYQWYLNGVVAGNNQSTYTYVPADDDQVYVSMSSSLTCSSGNPAVSDVISITVNDPLPVSVSISPDQNNICIGTQVTFNATPVNGGTPVYQWYINGIDTGASLASYTCTPVNGDQVWVVMTSGLSCISGNPATSDIVTMAVNTPVFSGVSIAVSQNNLCQGTSVTFTATPVNGGTPYYQWYLNGSATGLDQATFSYIPINGDQVYVVMTSGLSCVSGSPATSDTITMVVNAPLQVSVSVSPGQNNICQGTQVTFTATPANGGTPAYQWYLNGNPVGLSQPTYAYTPVNGDQVYVVMTSDLSCVSGNPATSNTVTMVVNTPLPVSVTVAASQNNICQGTSVTFTATPVNGGIPVYQWYRNGIPVWINQPTYTCIPANGYQVNVVMTSGLSCITGSPATSNDVIMIVNPILPVSVTVSASQNNVCLGTSVTLTAVPVNGGTPVYQWYKNGIAVGSNQATYSYIPANGDQVYVIMTSNLPCISGSPATSDTVTMTVNNPLPVSVSINESQNNICQGMSVTYTAVAVNGGTPFYQWYKNGSLTGSNQPVYSCIPNNGDQVYVVMTSDLSCIVGNPDTSNIITMTVDPLLPVSVGIGVSQNNICQGTSVTYTATPVNGGIPVYQWYRNSILVGSNQPTYTCIPDNDDQVYVVMTSNLQCMSGSPATSNTIIMIVNPILPVSVLISPDQNNICLGTTVTYTAIPVNGGTPAYQWYKNGVAVGYDQATYSNIPANNDQVLVVMTSNLSCISGNPATSNTVTMTVNNPLPVSVSINASQNNICQGTPVTFTATPVNGGTPVYQWFKNGSPVGSNLSTYSYIPENGDQVYVVMTSGLSCITGSPATSDTIVMTVNPILPVSVGINVSQNNICQGTSVMFTATPVNGGTPNYQWYRNSLSVGSDQSTYTCIPDNDDQVYIVMTSNLQCISGSPATSNTITMIVNPILSVSVSISPDQNNICQGTAVTFTAMPVNGGTPSYQWYVNGSTDGTDQNTYTYVPGNGDQVYVVMTSSLPCITGSPATSNTVTMNVLDIVPVSVTISESQNNVCAGTSVTFTATPVNPGSSPIFQWYVNSNPVGTNSSTFSYIPVNNDEIHVILTSSLPCTSGSPATSNTVTMTVNDIVPVSVSIVESQNNICAGTVITFTAIPVNGGTPFYQWYVNGLPVGTNQDTYTYVPSNSDQIYVLMTSSLPCVSGNPATSNTIVMTVISLPSPAGMISGPPAVCAGDTGVIFSVDPIGGATSYVWTLPPGANITAGNNTPTITVSFSLNAASGVIKVWGSNVCGTGLPSPDFNITVNPIPPAPVVTATGQLLQSSAPSGNQWYYQGTAISGATGQTYYATQSGWYWTIVTLNECSSDSSNHVYVLCVGVDEKHAAKKFKVYPVPNNGYFTLAVTEPAPAILNIMVYNNLGIPVYEIRNIEVRGSFEQKIDLRPVASGIYSVVFTDNDNRIVKRILIHK